jgi:hypothetical protein
LGYCKGKEEGKCGQYQNFTFDDCVSDHAQQNVESLFNCSLYSRDKNQCLLNKHAKETTSNILSELYGRFIIIFLKQDLLGQVTSTVVQTAAVERKD